MQKCQKKNQKTSFAGLDKSAGNTLKVATIESRVFWFEEKKN